MANIPESEIDPSVIDSMLSMLDSGVGHAVKSSRGMSLNDFVDQLMGILTGASFTTVVHSIGDKTAVVGTNSGYKSKVQLVWDATGFVQYVRFNGQPYDAADHQPVWDTSNLNWQADGQKQAVVKFSYFYRGPIDPNRRDTYRRTNRSSNFSTIFK